MTFFGRESCWAAKAGAIGRRMDVLKQQIDEAKTVAEYRHLNDELERLDGKWDYAASESERAECIMLRINDLTGEGARCVVAYDFSNWDLFLGETTNGWIQQGVLEAPLYVEVVKCPVTNDVTQHLKETAHITICAPLPPGWCEDTHNDEDLKPQLCDIMCIQRMADQGHGNYHMFFSSKGTTGFWSGRFTWRVFYDANYGYKSISAPTPTPTKA